MDSNNRLNTIVKYKLLVIIGLFVVAVLNGARHADLVIQDDPLYNEYVSSGNNESDRPDHMFNQNYPVHYLELTE